MLDRSDTIGTSTLSGASRSLRVRFKKLAVMTLLPVHRTRSRLAAFKAFEPTSFKPSIAFFETRTDSALLGP